MFNIILAHISYFTRNIIIKCWFCLNIYPIILFPFYFINNFFISLHFVPYVLIANNNRMIIITILIIIIIIIIIIKIIIKIIIIILLLL